MKFEKADLMKLYVNMVRAEAYDQWLLRKSMTGEMKAHYHPLWGDFIGVGACTFLRADDVIYVPHRGHGLPRDQRIRTRPDGKGNRLLTNLERWPTLIPGTGIYGGQCWSLLLPQVGAGGADERKSGRGVFFGDGTVNRGTRGQCVSPLKLPVVWVCGARMEYVPIKCQSAGRPCQSGVGLWHSLAVVDRQDVIVAEAVTVAVEQAREGRGLRL
jgi:TPP-dependent pyruvate/acetoin dehydrogenase alpha subunit